MARPFRAASASPGHPVWHRVDPAGGPAGQRLRRGARCWRWGATLLVLSKMGG